MDRMDLMGQWFDERFPLALKVSLVLHDARTLCVNHLVIVNTANQREATLLLILWKSQDSQVTHRLKVLKEYTKGICR